jgi:hypothetical protein
VDVATNEMLPSFLMTQVCCANGFEISILCLAGTLFISIGALLTCRILKNFSSAKWMCTHVQCLWRSFINIRRPRIRR